jgi:hypothetical protein
MTKSARIGLAAALLFSGASVAVAQNGPATGGYPPARWNPNLNYGYYDYYYAQPAYTPFYYPAPYYYPGNYPGYPASSYMGWGGWR